MVKKIKMTKDYKKKEKQIHYKIKQNAQTE